MFVLVTGAAGRVGTVVARGLRASGHRVRGFDRAPMSDLDEAARGDLADADAVRRAMDGVEAVIHLGGNAGDVPWPEIRSNNYDGCYHVFEAARQLGVRRVAFASRAGLLAAYPRCLQRTADLLPRPRGLYDCSKVLGEGLGYMYAARFGMECVCVRIGNLSPDRDQPQHPHHLSHGDCVRVFEAAITHPGVRYEVVFGVSASDWPLYDLDHGRRAIGYHPQDLSRVPGDQRDLGQDAPADRLPDRPPRRVLVTGAAGRIGSAVVGGLQERYQVRGFDRVDMPELKDKVVADVGDFGACLRATEGVDAVIHLAGVPSGGAPWPEVLACNVDGTYNLLEAARRNGVPRFAFASRAGLLGPHGRSRQRTVAMAPLPESFYSLSKVFGEGLGHAYRWNYGMQFVGVRIGNFKPERPEPEHPHHLGHGDCVRLFEAAISHPGAGYELVFGVSASNWPLYDLDHGRRAIGYQPQQRSHVPEEEWER